MALSSLHLGCRTLAFLALYFHRSLSSFAFLHDSSTLSSRLKKWPITNHSLRAKASLGAQSEATGYISPEDSEKTRIQQAKKRIYPAIGDIVRFYDVDGGQQKGQLLIGRISFIQKNLGREGSGWTVEIVQMDDVGKGYYADYPLQQKRNKRTTRDLAAVSPVTASFVRSEAAYKVPLDNVTGQLSVRAEQYDIEDYEGPMANLKINQNIVQADALLYGSLKSKILRYTALTGLFGTIVADLSQGPQDASIYFGGVVASILYLFLLTIKTDTVASADAKFGRSISNARFLMPLVLVVVIAGYNKSLGDLNPVRGMGPFELVTTEQFAAGTLGFLSYRIPLFLTQIADAFKEDIDEGILPGSIGIAAKMVENASRSETETAAADPLSKLDTILLVSGPQATGRSVLVQKLVEEGNGRYIVPEMVDRRKNGARFEQLLARQEFLYVDQSERYGLTRDAIPKAAKSCGPQSVVVVDADVPLAKRLKETKGLRLVGVWVGLGTMKEFESRIQDMIERGEIGIPADETRESITRAQTKKIVQEIEFGVTSGLFEFTILNSDLETSLRELREAASYCFN